MKKVEEEDKSYQAALRLLSYKARTEAEMEKLLQERRFSPEQIAATIKRLKDVRYLDDNQYAYQRCRYLAEVKFFGPLQIRAKLDAKRVKEELINKVLTEYFSENDEAFFLRKAVAKKLRQEGKPETLKEFKRLFDFVRRRGFHHKPIWQELGKYKKAIDRKKYRGE